METVRDFIFLGSKITADDDFSHEIKRSLLLGRKAMTNLDSRLKSRDITWQTKVYIVKATVFPEVIYGCKSWIIKMAEHWRTDAFVLWCWRRLLRVPWTARRSNQSILKEINPEYFLDELMLRLKLQYFGKDWLIRKDLDAEKDCRQEEKGMTDDMVGWYHWLDGHELEETLGDGEGQGSLAYFSPYGCKESDTTKRLNRNNNTPPNSPLPTSTCHTLSGFYLWPNYLAHIWPLIFTYPSWRDSLKGDKNGQELTPYNT